MNVSDNFQELEFFRGRYLRHIYEHKSMIDKDWQNETNLYVDKFYNDPPTFQRPDLEMRKATKKKRAELEKKTKPIDTYFLGLNN